jgi:hypothetical protein
MCGLLNERGIAHRYEEFPDNHTGAGQVVPLLQKRGRFRRSYEATRTLRERFGFPRPARMLPAGARSVASLLQKQAG